MAEVVEWDRAKYSDRYTLNEKGKPTPGCAICLDWGWHEWQHGSRIGGPVKWCLCAAGRARQIAEPDLLKTIAAEKAQFAEKFA